MFRQTLIVFVLLAGVLAYAPTTNAQTTNVAQMVARMKEIAVEMQQLQTEFLSLANKLGASSGASSVLGAQTSVAAPVSSAPVFTQPLVFGETNDDIKKIQALLATDPEIYPYGVASGYFGPKTEEAIKNLQMRFGMDPVGVVGPSTTALLESYFNAYPSGNFPDGVLDTRPQVLGASTSNTETGVDALAQIAALQQQLSALKSQDDADEAEEEDEDRSSKHDEDDAYDAIEDAKAAIHDARDEIRKADDDGEDVDVADESYDEAREVYNEARDAFANKDWDEAVDLAEEAGDLADEAVDRIGDKAGKSANDIEDIFAYVGDDEAFIVVEYEDDDDDFTVDTEDEDDIIKEVADELDIDEEDVEDLITFYGKKVDSIDVEIDEDEGESYVVIEFEDGDDKTYTLDETDEDDIIEKLANKLDLPEKEVEKATDFN